MNLLAMEMQNVPPAPGQGEAPSTTTPSTQQPGDPAAGASPPGAGIGGVGMMLIMILPMILIIFYLNRSQTKKQKELESKLKKGDRVVCAGGIIGRIAEISPTSRYVKLEITSGVKIDILKSAIQGLDTGETPSASFSGAKSSEKGGKVTS